MTNSQSKMIVKKDFIPIFSNQMKDRLTKYVNSSKHVSLDILQDSLNNVWFRKEFNETSLMNNLIYEKQIY